MAYEIMWQRTVIGGDALHHDFCAEVYGITIARIRRLEHSDLKGMWEYSFQLGHSGFRCGDDNGHADTREAAIASIRQRFVAFLATPPPAGGGLDLTPPQWLPGYYEMR